MLKLFCIEYDLKHSHPVNVEPNVYKFLCRLLRSDRLNEGEGKGRYACSLSGLNEAFFEKRTFFLKGFSNAKSACRLYANFRIHVIHVGIFILKC